MSGRSSVILQIIYLLSIYFYLLYVESKISTSNLLEFVYIAGHALCTTRCQLTARFGQVLAVDCKSVLSLFIDQEKIRALTVSLSVKVHRLHN